MRECVTAAAVVARARIQCPARRGQFQQRIDRGQQLAVVPGLAQIVGGARADQFDRRFQTRPCGQQDDRQIGIETPDRMEQRDAFVARRGVGMEIHVLHHEVDPARLQAGDAGLGCRRVFAGDVVQREQHLQRGGDSGVVVDDEDRGHQVLDIR